MEEKVEQLCTDVAATKTDVAEIKTAIVGNEEYGQSGLVKRVAVLEAWQSDVVIKVAFASGCGFGIAVLIKFIITGKL